MADDHSINELFSRVYALEIFVVAAMQQLDRQALARELGDSRFRAIAAFQSSNASPAAIERVTRQLDRLESALGL